MLAKQITTFFCFVTAAVAYALPTPFSKHSHSAPHYQGDHHYPAQYEYQYSVKDEHNGDIKEQKENRHGDAVHGFYSLVQPDGIRRIVEYTVSKERGFNAVVRYEGHATPAKVPYTPKYTQPQPQPQYHSFPPPPPKAYSPHIPKIVSYSSPVSKISFTINGHNPAYAASDDNAAYSPPPEDYSAYAAPEDQADAEDYDTVAYADAPIADVAYLDAPPPNYEYASPANVYYDPTALALINMAAQAGHVTYTSPAYSYQH